MAFNHHKTFGKVIQIHNMGKKTIQEILPFLEKPSRYIGCEINAVKKDDAEINLHIALAFPDLYEIGTSHFGIQILYSLLNHREDIAAERVFAPGDDLEGFLRSQHLPLFSLESKKSLKSFDIIGFSLLYELNYTNVLLMMDLAGIPYLSSDRDDAHPIIIAGGPCMANPEPMAPFFDAMVIGDGEDVMLQMADIWLDWKNNGRQNKANLLDRWALIQGVYIPSRFTPVYSGTDDFNPDYPMEKFSGMRPESSQDSSIKKAILPDLDMQGYPETPIVPYGKPVHDRLRLEIARGCSRGCRFCQAGMIYRPVRERSLSTILEMGVDGLKHTGYDDLSLLSLSTGDHSNLNELIRQFMADCPAYHPMLKNTAISLPSIRADVLTPDVMNLIKKVRKTGFTIAPEAGSDRLRRVINKNLTENDIINTVASAFSLGWNVIKLYFMIGLPTETDEDIDSIVTLVKKLKSLKGSGRKKSTINVSVTTFIPKAHTPFQWLPQISLEESKRKIFYLKKSLEKPGIQFKWQDPKVSLLEGVWARGDRRLSDVLIKAYKNGCKFDGWRDWFSFDRWQRAFDAHHLDMTYFVEKHRETEDPLPWDHIDMGIHKSFLQKEWNRALTGEPTLDCRTGNCEGCGICDFKTIKPIVYTDEPSPGHQNTAQYSTIKQTDRETIPFHYHLTYSKQGVAKYLGHLELVNVFTRAIKRAAIPIKFSQGFHPKPKISFENPLPVGTETLEEVFIISLTEKKDPASLKTAINREMPQGIHITSCRLKLEKLPVSNRARYIVHTSGHSLNGDLLDQYFQKNESFITKTSKKGKLKSIDLKNIILKIEILDSFILSMLLKTDTGSAVRPSEIIKHIFLFKDEDLNSLNVMKIPVT